MSEQITHGTVYAYQHMKCRCEMCRTKNTERMREYNKRNPGVNAKNQKKKKLRRIEAGLCIDCGVPCSQTQRCPRCINRARQVARALKLETIGPVRTYFETFVFSMLLREDVFHPLNKLTAR